MIDEAQKHRVLPELCPVVFSREKCDSLVLYINDKKANKAKGKWHTHFFDPSTITAVRVDYVWTMIISQGWVLSKIIS